jgi:uncharacterized protein
MTSNAFTVTLEPVGACNLECRYCYSTRPSPTTLASDLAEHALAAIAAYACERGFDELHCIWLGGEPLLAGIRFFERVLSRTTGLELPARHFVQTNGLQLDEDYCRLFRDANVNVGISIDGPQDIHDAFRVSRAGEPTHSRVMKAISLLRKHLVPFGCAVVVSRATLGREQEVYGFFRSLGLDFRINPVIPGKKGWDSACQIEPAAYGAALVRFFDAWIAQDPIHVNVSPLDSYVAAVAAGEPEECQHQLSCVDRTLGIKSDGTVRICGRFQDILRERLGSSSVAEVLAAPDYIELQERPRLLEDCHACINWSICHGGCPHNAVAFGLEPTAKDPFCPAYKAIFARIRTALGAGGTGCFAP